MSTADTREGLHVTDLQVAYNGVPAVRGISFEVNAGEAVGLIGPNGAGKSSTLLAIMGAAARTGLVTVHGRDIAGLAPEKVVRTGLALVPEGRHVFTELSVADNLRLGAVARRDKSSYKEALEYVLDLFPILRDFGHRHAGLLSGGQQQQLAIARALAAGPKVLILDEPTEGIQPSIIKDIGRVIRMLADRGNMAIVLVEQYYDFAQELADQYVVMERGAVKAQGRGADMEAHGVRQMVAI